MVAAGLALPPRDSLFGNDWNHHQTCHRIGPPQPEERVEEQTAEQDSGQIRAEVGLPCVCGHRIATQSDPDALFASLDHTHRHPLTYTHYDPCPTPPFTLPTLPP